MTRARRRQPIFVARSGRRARQVRRVGWIVGVVMLGYLGLVVVSLSGVASVPGAVLPLDSAGGLEPTISPLRSHASDDAAAGAPDAPVSVASSNAAPSNGAPAGAPHASGTPSPPNGTAPANGNIAAVIAVPASATPETALPAGVQDRGQPTDVGKPTARPTHPGR